VRAGLKIMWTIYRCWRIRLGAEEGVKATR
jgi:hypothetical protein